ncbi:pyridoxamine 5'-phosphate oxidase family protein [Streptomyces turgidiscabies]|uniref:pyridoxamine 5'-phosphate oxidase family protein n=1 Tax=Streptomyces turgidiscabies TaxID=85558 RepID=UPI0038F8166E
MGAAQARSFAEIEAAFVEYVQQIVYCTMITVDRANRPRARVVLPVWEVVDARPVGWLAAYRTPVKAAHLANNPHTTYSYWHPCQNAVFVDSVSAWVHDPDTKLRAWELYHHNSPPGVGYDPHTFWDDGPTSSDYQLLRIDPWRVQVLRGSDLASRIWTDEPPE